jgi:hypothetical protein
LEFETNYIQYLIEEAHNETNSFTLDYQTLFESLVIFERVWPLHEFEEQPVESQDFKKLPIILEGFAIPHFNRKQIER